jgi:hypothetical protein
MYGNHPQIHPEISPGSPAHPPIWWRTTRCLSLFAVVLVMAGFGGAWIMGREPLFSNGPLAPYHANLEQGCSACHTAPFSHVQDSTCLDCHESTISYLANGHADHPAFLTQAERWEGRPMSRCGFCHLEHRGDVPATDMDERLCTYCHSLLPTASGRNVSGFSEKKGSHPQFRLHRENSSDPDRIKFSHARHLGQVPIEGTGGEEIKKEISCNDCHVPDMEGKGMLPVQYEKHCSTCHKLRTGRSQGDGDAVPHEKPEVIRSFLLRKYFETPGGIDETRLSQLVDEDEASLFYREGGSRCVECHFVHPGDPEADGSPGLPEIVPPEIPARWFLFSVFSHKPHTTLDCKECHFVIEHKSGEHVFGKGVEESTTAQDVLIPPLEVCVKCHQPDQARTNCTLCHTFHPTREELALRRVE